ncbi:Protein RPAC-40 [Aphelenchoides avenae]|nr:Protein RPAC-40 [Aphelenchus avenae]
MVKKGSRKEQQAQSSRQEEREVKPLPPDELVMKEELVDNTYDRLHTSWDVDDYTHRIRVDVISESDDGMTLEFDLVHIEAPIANAIRRILIAEVPTMAIEKVYLYQNTSCIQDEVLCHRLGLLPIYADPRKFALPDQPTQGVNEKGADCEEEPEGNPKQNLVFQLQVKCTKKKNAPADVTDPEKLYNHAVVRTGAFKWIPIGGQAKELAADPPRMVNDDIVLAKMRPGQEIEASCHCMKGVGRDHAKFSPVATASYRLLPTIRLNRRVEGEDAELLKTCFSEGVIALDDEGGVAVARVENTRKDTCSRNVFRHGTLKDAVELAKQKDHFIFSVESVGALRSNELVVEACEVMQSKVRNLRALLQQQLSK